MKRNIVFGPNPSISRWIYTDVIEDNNSEYCDFDEKNNTKLKHLLFSRKLQEALPHWAKRILYRRLLKYDFLNQVSSGEGTTFLFTCQFTMFFMTCFWQFVKFLKQEYPQARFAFYYYDIIYTCCPELVEKVKAEFPKVLTFDPGDAEKYGLEYYGEICSSHVPDGDNDIQPFDIFYAGGDRGRFDTLLESFKTMSDQGRKCVFYVIDIDPKNIGKLKDFFATESFNPKNGASFKYKSSIMHCNIYCPYPQALNHIAKTKCLFEVVFPGQTSGSLRLPQACIYGKKLITNCQWVVNRSFYNPLNISLFETPDQIDTSFIDTPPKDVNYNFSPLALIQHVNNTYNQ